MNSPEHIEKGPPMVVGSSDWLGVGRTITVKAGATRWMKERGFWLNEWPESIDGMTMEVIADYTHLGGDSAHWWCENETVKDCGIHPDFLSPNTRDDRRRSPDSAQPNGA